MAGITPFARAAGALLYTRLVTTYPRLFVALPLLLMASTASVRAQQMDDATPEPQAVAGRAESHRMFGVLPNYAMVETSTVATPITTKQTFTAAAKNSFDPFVFSFAGFTAALGQGGAGDYAQRYTTVLADTAIGNMMTSAVMPAALHYDPRYYELGAGGLLHRTGYALSRTLVTRTRRGETRFNVPEIGGNLAAASISNVYYAPADRSVTDTLTRWGTQVMWDAVSNELKEFWPDIRTFMRARQRPVQ